MKVLEELCKAIEDAESLKKRVEKIKVGVVGYDLLRYLKTVDAELMDVLHNLDRARKLVE